jgi:hypothetical protein
MQLCISFPGEIGLVREFLANNIHGDNYNKFVALLEYIKVTPAHRMLFHPHHIKDTARLREGSKAVERKVNRF